MKKIIVASISLFIMTIGHSQSNFKWDKIDSISKSKNEIYSLTKMYIGEAWKSAQSVIQNDDKEGGAILVKGLSIQSLYYQMHDHKWTFSYSIKFLFKDNKYRVVIDDVYCQSAKVAQYDWPNMPVADTYPAEKGLKTTGVNEERYLKIMTSLKQELQGILDGYEGYLKKDNTTKNNGDW
jgi:hypothetical protein